MFFVSNNQQLQTNLKLPRLCAIEKLPIFGENRRFYHSLNYFKINTVNISCKSLSKLINKNLIASAIFELRRKFIGKWFDIPGTDLGTSF